jgi:dihydrofolate synthase/folylpolyglutamate synthase
MPIIEEIQPSFFEITVAMAFHYFAQKKVDIAIIETGLGGRLDSTNIIHPELSVITNISYDHQSILGNTLTEIAREKAGIIKKNTPVVIGRKNAETDKVFIETSKQQNAKLFFSEDTTKLIESKQNNKYNKVRYAIKSKERKIKSDLSGKYQVENIQTILSSIDIYNRNAKNKIKQKNIEQGLSNVCTNTKLLARWQCIGKNPKTIIDVAHNEDGINHALEQLKNEQYNHLHIIYSAVKDKDIDKILPLLPKDATYYFTEAKIERKLDANILLESAKKHQLNGNAFTEPQNALQQAKKASKNNDLILIIGSFFILEDILSKKS